MKNLLGQCHEAWRGPRIIPVQYRHDATPFGLLLRRERGISAMAHRLALAAMPLLPLWLWNSGAQMKAAATAAELEAVSGWRAWLLMTDGHAAVPDWQVGLAYFLPLVLVSMAAAALTETLYAAARRGRVEADWYLPPWLFALLLPPGVDLMQAAVAIALGVLLGRLVLGGPGKYLVSPALLGALLLVSGHPDSFCMSPPGAEDPCAAGSTVWSAWVGGGLGSAQAAGGSWVAVFLGREASVTGATSTLACLAAAVYLAVAGIISWRTLLGGVLGLAVAATAMTYFAAPGSVSDMPWYWHASLGGFAFVLVFLAADPGGAPLTPGGRWFLGLTMGGLTVLIRVLDPSHPDGSLHAALLAALFAPLADEWVTRRAIARRLRREASWP